MCKLSKDWQRQMGVSSEAAKKPFYNVLVEDSSNRYAAQGIPINWCTPRTFMYIMYTYV